jgi:hypothetical protein
MDNFSRYGQALTHNYYMASNASGEKADLDLFVQSDLGLFVQTSPYGLGLYKKDFGLIFLCTETSRSVNNKLVTVFPLRPRSRLLTS